MAGAAAAGGSGGGGSGRGYSASQHRHGGSGGGVGGGWASEPRGGASAAAGGGHDSGGGDDDEDDDEEDNEWRHDGRDWNPSPSAAATEAVHRHHHHHHHQQQQQHGGDWAEDPGEVELGTWRPDGGGAGRAYPQLPPPEPAPPWHTPKLRPPPPALARPLGAAGAAAGAPGAAGAAARFWLPRALLGRAWTPWGGQSGGALVPSTSPPAPAPLGLPPGGAGGAVPDSWEDVAHGTALLPPPSPSSSLASLRSGGAATAAGAARGWPLSPLPASPYGAIGRGSRSASASDLSAARGGAASEDDLTALLAAAAAAAAAQGDSSCATSFTSAGGPDSSWPATPRSLGGASSLGGGSLVAAAGAAAGKQAVAAAAAGGFDMRHDEPLAAGAMGDAAAIAEAIHGRLSKSQRRRFAAALDAFWAQFYDAHGRPCGGDGGGDGGGGAASVWPPPAAAGPGAPLACAHLAAPRAPNAPLCAACSDALLLRVRACVDGLQQIGGAAAVLRAEDAALPSAAAPGALGALPLPPRARAAFWPDAVLEAGAAARHLRAVAALAAGNVPWAHATAAAGAVAPCSGGGGDGSDEAIAAESAAAAAAGAGGGWPWRGPFGGAPLQGVGGPALSPGGASGSGAGISAGGGGLVRREELGAALFASWGLWCALVLLVWAQVEVRPELLGAYAPSLNRLQGLLAAVGLAPPAAAEQAGGDGGQQQQQQQQPHAPWWPWPDAEREALRALLLTQLAALEAVVGERRAAAGSGAAGAYAAAKRVALSVVKRLRRRLLAQQQQPGGGGGGDAQGMGGDAQAGGGGSGGPAKRARHGAPGRGERSPGPHRPQQHSRRGGGRGAGTGASSFLSLVMPLFAGALVFAAFVSSGAGRSSTGASALAPLSRR